ncbi:hypothetical protein A4X06_0g927 [Tilletia controversa]|uniref:Uncharacterized protein n=1 Tax=Tilletia controversa TaxID=13291 RepID=A0A8X7MZB2_9BASI|nr:hypothetical protein CF328_g2630 [Tilletia controversa]KAE8254366.1 hypothetical protein A4X06_0g927 [Tilletia controversa]CAD6980351.1 unnamed protein product [Tilletia controversa]
MSDAAPIDVNDMSLEQLGRILLARASRAQEREGTQSNLASSSGGAAGVPVTPEERRPSGLASDSSSDWRSGGSSHSTSASSLASGSSGAAAAARFSFAAGQAKATVRGRSSAGKTAPSPAVAISKNEIALLPFAAWVLSMYNKGKPKGEAGTVQDLNAFLYKQGCIITSKGIKRSMTSAEVMDHIIAEFKKQSWNLAENGFRYAKVRGSSRELVQAIFAPVDVDGAKLEMEYSSSRCYIVMNTRNVQTNSETHAAEHICPRQDKPLVPRVPGFRGKVGGMKSIDRQRTDFWLGDLAGIHLIDDLPQDLKDQGATTVPTLAPDFNNVDNDDFEPEDDWTCMFCKLVAKANKNKCRRLNRQPAY